MTPLSRRSLDADKQSAINTYRLNVNTLSSLTSPTLVSLLWRTLEQGDLSNFVDWLPSLNAQSLFDCFFHAICDLSLTETQDELSLHPEDQWMDVLGEMIEQAGPCPFWGTSLFMNSFLDSLPPTQQELAAQIAVWFQVDLNEVFTQELLPAMLRAQQRVL